MNATATPAEKTATFPNAGSRFRVYGADSLGTITASSPQAISYHYDHAPDQSWGMKAGDFLKIAYPLT